MNNFMKTIINAVKSWTKSEIKESTADWNENDKNADSYVKNRTHYEEKILKKIFDESVFYESGICEFGSDDSPITLSLDTIYKVIWNGVTYECIPYEFDDGNGVAIGSSLFMGAPEEYGNNEPFFISYFSGNSFIEVYVKEHATNHAFSFYSIVDGVETAILENEEVYTLAWGGSFEDYPKITTEEGKKYNVIFDEEKFECILKYDSYDDSYYLGNNIWLENTGEPFYICTDNWVDDDGTTRYWTEFASKYAGNHKITISEYETVIHKLDTKYLPDDIGIETPDEEILFDQDVTWQYDTNNGYYYYRFNNNLPMVGGEIYKIVFDDYTFYTIPALDYGDDGIGGAIFKTRTSYNASDYFGGILNSYSIDLDFTPSATSHLVISHIKQINNVLNIGHLSKNIATVSDIGRAHERIDNIDLTINNLDNKYLSKNNPSGTGNFTLSDGSFSMNRLSGSIRGQNSTTLGYNNTASGSYSHAEGYSTEASGDESHVEGNGTTASGYASHAEGDSATASGYASHAEGYNSIASGDYSHAEGYGTTARNRSAHVEGEYNIPENVYSFGEGLSSTISLKKSSVIDLYKNVIVDENDNISLDNSVNTVIEDNSLGDSDRINYYFRQGYYYMILPDDSTPVKIKNWYDGSTGYKNIDVEELVVRRSKIQGKYVHIVGNGWNENNRSNAHTLDWNGNAWYQGDVYVGGEDQDNGAKKLATEEYVDNAIDEAIESGDFGGDGGIYVGDGEAPEGTKVQIDTSDNGSEFTIPDVLQTTGDSEVDTMSQKAITKALAMSGGGIGSTFGNKTLLMDETIDIPADVPVTSISLTMPDNVGDFDIFDIYVEKQKPTNEFTSAGTMNFKLMGQHLVYYGFSKMTANYENILMRVYFQRNTVEFAVSSVGFSTNAFQPRQAWNWIKEPTEAQRKNTEFLFQLGTSYSGSITVKIWGYK